MKNNYRDVKLIQNSQITRKVTLTGMFLNLLLAVSKIIAGLIGNSSSVIADGVHSLSDLSTDIAVLIGVKYWNEPPDAEHPYGHRRIEAMISVFIAIALSIAGLILGYGAIIKFRSADYKAPESFTLIIAIISIVSKEWLYQWTHKWGKNISSPAMIANAWHHRSDSLSSIPVALAIGLAVYNPAWAFMDPVATLAVSAFIIQTAYKISLPSLKELSDAGADQKSLETIEQLVLQVEGVKSVHAVRSRFHGAELYVDLHIQVDGKLTVEEGHVISGIAKRHLIEKGPDITDVLVHIEPFENLSSEKRT